MKQGMYFCLEVYINAVFVQLLVGSKQVNAFRFHAVIIGQAIHTLAVVTTQKVLS